MARVQAMQQAQEHHGRPEVARHTNQLLHDREQQDGMTVCIHEILSVAVS
jgi:hypothetical protein